MYITNVSPALQLLNMTANSNDGRENLSSQICELEALQSVYPTELSIADHGTLADINSFISGANREFPKKLEYTLKIPIPQVNKVELKF